MVRSNPPDEVKAQSAAFKHANNLPEISSREYGDIRVAAGKGAKRFMQLKKKGELPLPRRRVAAAAATNTNGLPGLNDRALGWLKFLHQKATTAGTRIALPFFPLHPPSYIPYSYPAPAIPI
jgi:hypothetical protein